jgi:lipopolysaccharide/colanic/teichoic acid biosynthesis glycosyltransferase
MVLGYRSTALSGTGRIAGYPGHVEPETQSNKTETVQPNLPSSVIDLRRRSMTFDRTDTASVAADAGSLSRERRMPLVGRIRLQLGGAVVMALLAPLLLRWPMASLKLEFISSSMILPSLVAAVIAITGGFWLNRQITVYPGVSDTAYLLPSLATTFGFMALVLFFLRIDYSRYIILTSFVASLSWLYIACYIRSRHAVPVLAVVPGGSTKQIAHIKGANWLMLKSQRVALKGVEGVVADLHADLPEAWQRYIAKCILAGIPVYDVKNIVESLTGRVEVEHLSENSFGSVLPSNLYLRLKRGIDLILALLLFPPFSLVIIAVAVAIKLDSPGPIFYSQKRMGYRARIFSIYKLRSMVPEHSMDQHFTSDGDARITRVGHLLRKYRIDELPQILNVLRGDMSWFGPRPEAVELADWYSKEIPFYIYRHAVRPGLSGWAQVNQGNVANIDAASLKLQYDFFYIKNFSPVLDLVILMKTFKTILTGFGSK